MFHKLVAIEPVSLIPSAEQELHQYAEEVTLYRDIPADDDEIVRRIGDADAVLLSYTSRMGKSVIERCPNIAPAASRCWASGTTATAALWSTFCTSSSASCTVLECPCCGTSRWRSPG